MKRRKIEKLVSDGLRQTSKQTDKQTLSISGKGTNKKYFSIYTFIYVQSTKIAFKEIVVFNSLVGIVFVIDILVIRIFEMVLFALVIADVDDVFILKKFE